MADYKIEAKNSRLAKMKKYEDGGAVNLRQPGPNRPWPGETEFSDHLQEMSQSDATQRAMREGAYKNGTYDGRMPSGDSVDRMTGQRK